jgi:hypothetical protein
MEVDTTVSALIDILHSKCPHLHPNIFPSYAKTQSLDDIFVISKHRMQYQQWLDKIEGANDIIINSRIDYANREVIIDRLSIASATESQLRNLETVMVLLVKGGVREIDVAVKYFLDINGYTDLSEMEQKRVFQEIYNVSYAIKVAIR